ncbi:unnamed protein product [Paramecium octaurelia]|uniref:Transmembrane protein n=1 Tax=Paramecium octaurelia TaxID=43137 RepID=A0A8S1RZW5_PAROT|nr:unnamed protein product [Paramecium octaurelia]
MMKPQDQINGKIFQGIRELTIQKCYKWKVQQILHYNWRMFYITLIMLLVHTLHTNTSLNLCCKKKINQNQIQNKYYITSGREGSLIVGFTFYIGNNEKRRVFSIGYISREKTQVKQERSIDHNLSFILKNN